MYLNSKGVELATSAAYNNRVIGSTGRTTRVGTIKNDVFDSAAGDKMLGGKGDDAYNLWDSTASVVELGSEGVDTVNAGFWGAYTLPDNVENLFLKSLGSTAGTGNAQNNIIVAGVVGATLNGMRGDDVLVGGTGADIFKVAAGNGSDAIMKFQVGKDVIQLAGYDITSFAQLKALGTQVGADVRFNLKGGEALVVRDVNLADLGATDFGLQAPRAPIAAGYVLQEGAGKAWNANGWYVLNNVWNPGTLVQGKDFTVDSVYNRGDMTKGTTFHWSFPYVTNPGQTILAYPEVIFGTPPNGAYARNPTDTAHVFPLKVADIAGLIADYSVSMNGNTAGFNVSYDIWLTSKPNGDKSTITNEIMVWLHQGDVKPFGKAVGTYTDGAFSGTIYHTGTYTAIVADKDVLSGKIDIAKLLDKLESLGIVSDKEYLASIELGAEVVSGQGSLTINNLDLTVKSHGDNGSLITKEVTGSGTIVTEHSVLEQMFAPGKSQWFDDFGALEGTKSTTFDAAGAATVRLFDQTAKLVGVDKISRDASGKITTTHLDAAGKLVGTEITVTDAKGAVTTQHLDALGRLAGSDVTTVTTAKTSVQHFDAAGKLTGSDGIVTNADGSTTTQHFDSGWMFAGADTVKVDAKGATTIQHYDKNWQLTGADIDSVDAKGALLTQHFDKAWKFAGADSATTGADGAVTTSHFNGSWGVIGADILRFDAKGVATETHFNAKWAMTGADYTGTSGADAITTTSGTSNVHAGLGSDTIRAGSGADNFYFDTAIGKGDVDLIVGFSAATDTFFLDQDVFFGMKSVGTLDASAFVVGTRAGDANDRIVYDKATGNIFYDADGNGAGAAILFAQVNANTTLSHADFAVVL